MSFVDCDGQRPPAVVARGGALRAKGWRRYAGLAAIGLWATPAAQAILFHSTGDPGVNTAPPGGSLMDSGWQWQGRWGAFLGTPIHPKYFITAAHIGGRIGQALELGGRSYLTTFSTNVPGTDLRLWRICGQFVDYAPVHTNGATVGRGLVWFGRGTQRGAEVLVTNGMIPELRGWEWGPGDGVVRWGTNRVEAITDGGEGVGPLLRAAFDADGGADECHLSPGDSGGGAFVLENGRWELAGIHYSVDGPYRRTLDGTNLNAALFDHRGFFAYDGTNWVEMLEEEPPAGSLYATDVSAHAEWILEFLSQPVPDDSAPVLQRAAAAGGVYSDAAGALVDLQTHTIRVSLPTAPAYFRLRSCNPSRITGLATDDTTLVLHYE